MCLQSPWLQVCVTNETWPPARPRCCEGTWALRGTAFGGLLPVLANSNSLLQACEDTFSGRNPRRTLGLHGRFMGSLPENPFKCRLEIRLIEDSASFALLVGPAQSIFLTRSQLPTSSNISPNLAGAAPYSTLELGAS